MRLIYLPPQPHLPVYDLDVEESQTPSKGFLEVSPLTHPVEKVFDGHLTAVVFYLSLHESREGPLPLVWIESMSH